MDRLSWRTIVATWSGAAWLVLRQFGVLAASQRDARQHEIQLVEESGAGATSRERLPDGRMLTLPLERDPRLHHPPTHFHNHRGFSAN